MSEVPSWFVGSLDRSASEQRVDVDGCSIAYRTWGEPGPGIVLVHGGAAHSHWWDHIGPWLAQEYRVAALDLSGHGDSGRRSKYLHDLWVKEVLAVAQAAEIRERPVIVGHSMGGWVAFGVGAAAGDLAAGVIVIDSPIRRPDPEEVAAQQHTAFGPLRVYSTREDAIARFRTIPDDPHSLDYVLAHIAGTSVRKVADGWTWKFDPAVFGRPRPRPDLLRQITTRVAVLSAQYGLVTKDIGAYMYDLLGRTAPVIEIPLAGHHVMLDQPIALVTALRSLLADWRHSSPRALGAS
jgi:pimeloyl-ACP methyl ester carboxylesterase